MERLLSNSLNGALDTITAPIQNWLATHPTFHWFFTHPFWLIGLILLLLFLLSGLLGAIARLTETVWLVILRSPLKITQWIWQRSFNFASNMVIAKGNADKPGQSKQERVNEILNRLEAIRQEQDQLLQEVKALLVEE